MAAGVIREALMATTANELPPERRSQHILQGRRIPLPWPKDKPFRILAIDGGGIRGILPACILSELESRYVEGKSIGRHFDMIAGTSTGGIIALALGLGIPARRVLDIYMENGARIFPREDFGGIPFIGGLSQLWRTYSDMKRYRYERAPLAKALSAEFGERVLGEALCRLAVPSFDGYGEVTVFKTPHHPDYKMDWKEQVVDVALSTAAAPTFFSTYRKGNRQFADGGIWANNPIMIALVDVLACYDLDRGNIRILSLGCADGEYKITVDQEVKGGIWHWREIFSAASHLQGQNAWGQAGLLIGRNNITRLDHTPNLSPIPIDDFVRASMELPTVASQIVDESGDDVRKQFLTDVAEPFAAFHGPRGAVGN